MSLNDITARLAEIKKIVEKDGRAMLKEVFAEFFEAHPYIEAVCWAQYTPYFNDGEPCEFSINDFEALPNIQKAREVGLDAHVDKWLSENEGYEEGDWEYCWGEGFIPHYLDVPAALKQAKVDLDELQKACNSVDTIVMEPVLGDHVLVKVSRDGFEVEEYSHD